MPKMNKKVQIYKTISCPKVTKLSILVPDFADFLNFPTFEVTKNYFYSIKVAKLNALKVD